MRCSTSRWVALLRSPPSSLPRSIARANRMLREIVLATHNPHKVVEFQEILGAAAPGIVVLPYDGPETSEDGTSFGDNALIKARAAARHTVGHALACAWVLPACNLDRAP